MSSWASVVSVSNTSEGSANRDGDLCAGVSPTTLVLPDATAQETPVRETPSITRTAVHAVTWPQRFLCNDFLKGRECTFGAKCFHAHSFEEHNPEMCRYGMRCNRVARKGKDITALPNQWCMFIHPGEELSNARARIAASMAR